MDVVCGMLTGVKMLADNFSGQSRFCRAVAETRSPYVFECLYKVLNFGVPVEHVDDKVVFGNTYGCGGWNDVGVDVRSAVT